MEYFQLSATEKGRIRFAVCDMLREIGANYFVTANFNRDETFIGARRCLRDWHARVDRKIVGKDWCRRPLDERTLFFGFPEHPDTNLHYHLLVRAPSHANRAGFDNVAEPAWTRLVQGGSLYVQELKTERDVARVCSYVTKDQWQERLVEQWIISSEFMT